MNLLETKIINLEKDPSKYLRIFNDNINSGYAQHQDNSYQSNCFGTTTYLMNQNKNMINLAEIYQKTIQNECENNPIFGNPQDIFKEAIIPNIDMPGYITAPLMEFFLDTSCEKIDELNKSPNCIISFWIKFDFEKKELIHTGIEINSPTSENRLFHQPYCGGYYSYTNVKECVNQLENPERFKILVERHRILD